MLKKQFIFKYDPSASLKEMFDGFNGALKTGRPDIQPPNTLVSNNLEAICHIQALQGLEIIKLKKVGKEIKPIALYEQITFDFSAVRKPSTTPSLHLTTNP
ncbi:911_t:CDS:2 [Cetraspora pellucida]|uniref:911_t:CDS:1 n=1 Tax=Cetraspora pellucida TaxID=1433469 RepID=A0ACA9K706_9GLOM|nr:911_t:CDS:2 [Cetraspora pellucida]